MANKATKRSDNRFEIKVSIGGGKRLSVYGSTEAEARKKAKELRDKAAKYDLANISKLSVQSYMEHWLYTVKIHELKPSSFDRVEQSCKYQIFPHIGSIQMQALTTDDIQHMLSEIAKTHSYSTMKKAYNNLNSCLSLGTAKNEILRNPMLTVSLPAKAKQETKEIRAYNRNEISAIVQECTRKYRNGKYVYRYGYAFLLMLNTGIRLGEALYLKWEDVDFESNTIYIHGNVSEHKSREKGETKYIIEEQHTPKTKKSVRYVSLNKNAAEALRKLKEIVNDDKRVIATEEHTIVSPHNMHRIFSSILRKCNITGVNDIVHSLRHTFATTLILKGEDIKVVSELLGHSDVGTTMRTYYHTIEKQKKKAVRQLARPNAVGRKTFPHFYRKENSMAHVEKYTRGAMGNMLAHYNRTKASSKSLIDPERTPLNYNHAATDQPLSQLDFIHKRLSKIKVLNRKDVNVFCDWIVTAPQELSENEYADFFRETYNFLNNRYGKENVISAYVHMDESQPHIHYAFVPVAIDKKKNIPKLSAKEVITLKELKSFHKDLSTHLNSFFGRDIGILNGATDLGNQTIKQLRNKKGSLKNYADTEIQTTTNIITKAMGKDKVVVSKADIEATQQAAADTAVLMDNIDAANDSIKKIREKAERNFAKSEERLLKVQERENAVAEREEKAALLERQNRNTSINNAIASEDIANRLKVCQERERQLEFRENSPHKFYGDQISELNKENSTLKKNISELKSDNNRIQENVTLLNQQLSEKEKSIAKRLAEKEREVAANYENRLREKDSIINNLKAAVDKAYHIICNICRAVAALWCGKGKFAEYCADFTPKQNALMCAILDYGAKCTREADFPNLADKIDTEYYIAEDIRQEMISVEAEGNIQQNEYFL